MPKVKICGITIPSQAKEISQAGADFIGVILYERSPRFVEFDKVEKIKENLMENTKLVGVVVNPDLESCRKILDVVDFIQFHGDEGFEFIKRFPKERVIKAFRIKNRADIENIKPYIDEDYLVLVDTFKEGEYGGTGDRIGIDILKEICSLYDKVIIAGGLSDTNIKYVLKMVKPYGVDASSKLEIKPGVKDIEKVKNFIKLVKDESDN